MAQMDTRLPLMVQQPDFVNALARSSQAAAQTNAVQDQNALRQLFQTQGADIAAGNQNALNALAGLDPMAALGVQDARQGMAARAEVMEQRRVAAKQQAAEYAATLDARQRAAEAAKIEAGITRGIGLYQAGDLNGLNELLMGVGEEPIQSLDEFPAVAAIYGDALDALKTVKGLNAPPKAADEYERYVREEEAAGRQPLDRIGFHKAKQRSSSIEMGPDGTVRITEGGASGLPKTTEGEKSSAGYLNRMRAAEEILGEISEEGPAVRSIASLLVGGTNFEGLVLSERQQKIMQAQRDWVRAKLRKESGAVIGADEMAEEVRTYFPLPGEGPEVVEQKRRARLEAERQFQIMSGNAAPQAERQPQQPKQDAPQGAPEVGVTEDGYRFLGGDPGDSKNWQKVE